MRVDAGLFIYALSYESRLREVLRCPGARRHLLILASSRSSSFPWSPPPSSHPPLPPNPSPPPTGPPPLGSVILLHPFPLRSVHQAPPPLQLIEVPVEVHRPAGRRLKL